MKATHNTLTHFSKKGNAFMARFLRRQRHQQLPQSLQILNPRRLFSPSRRAFRWLLITLTFIAVVPPVFFHFRLRHFHQMQLKKCDWLNDPPFVCAHGGDSINAFPNTMDAYRSAIHSQADCIEIDVSRSLDGVLFALHDRDLQQISGNSSSKVGHLSMKEIKGLGAAHRVDHKSNDQEIPTVEEALTFVSNSVTQVILDAKVGPPMYEKGLAKDILSVVQRTRCKNCLVWAKSDNLVRDIIRLSSDVTVGYIVMVDPKTGIRNNLLRIKKAKVVGVYHPLIDGKLVSILRRRNKKVYSWTVDDEDLMRKMLYEGIDAIVTSDPTSLRVVMQEVRTQCLEDGFSVQR
ncbi:glycerophosphodiester phosphodiesterase GDPD4 isoform X2 [Mangifera indica]|uniref:glycerophosphodiester phosphodiesterase GDPD4 isoform X2 n=1 Tax=Mangifera indica TaxID=29780 RepID=UPI001CFC20B2|nr:glycerophosphodiester phosphodiesterase GDPD4 isoform X2 [Mangifera indica]